MTISLFTGLPGSCKSLALVETIVRVRRESPDRPLYACGIDGLNVEGVRPLRDPSEWESLPEGSMIVVDEVQKFWPKSDYIPPFLQALSEHRHKGYDFVLATQNPTFLHTYVRKLVDLHMHSIRKFRSKMIQRITWGECVDDIKSTSKRKAGQSSLWRIDAKLFGLYKSASMHTMQARVPKRLYLAAAGLIAAGAVLWWFGHRGPKVSADAPAGAQVAPNVLSDHAAAGKRVLLGGQTGVHVMTPAEWVAMQKPRVEGIPWSAPIYDGLSPTELPIPRCILIPGRSDCRCFTDQGTRLAVLWRACVSIVTDGVYNPYARALTASNVQPQNTSPRHDSAIEWSAAGAALGVRGNRGVE